MDANTTSPRVEFGSSTVESKLKLKPSVPSPLSIETLTGLSSGDEPTLSKASPALIVAFGRQHGMNDTS
ncbi:hypothetical protein ACFXTI_028617 [Malus domestica]